MSQKRDTSTSLRAASRERDQGRPASLFPTEAELGWGTRLYLSDLAKASAYAKASAFAKATA